MTNKTLNEVKFLKIYSGFLSAVLLAVVLFLFNQSRETTFKEITVERINIIESNGDLKLVLSNSERQHSGIINGKDLPKRQRKAGLIFFNSAGDECGGLIYDGNDKQAGLVLSVDKYRDDQIMQLRYVENTANDARTYGLQFWEYPKEDGFDERSSAFDKLQLIEDAEEKKEALIKMKDDGLLPEDRMFVGKKMNNEVGLFINDNTGKPRIKIYIDKENNPKIELLNEEGTVLDKQ
ncbi:MAG: hypothetical protein KJ578_11550 [Bacteroidetes bacterium]|nr:hypothetical protein [Bacteroidota bacterium]MBU1580854.1 hypothetical protein [Bacteroidota bacterium]MBU2465207.1 hypothetical protein [Bacteroidota bacterium]MBU2558404.1 hypothetical protein [Bacteroidota bacterium]